MKAKFDTKQEEVKINIIDDTHYAYICLNENEIQEEQNGYDEDGNETTNTVTEYEYDYAELVYTDELTDEEVKASPEKYLNWKSDTQMTDKEKIADLETRLANAEEALQEVILINMEN